MRNSYIGRAFYSHPYTFITITNNVKFYIISVVLCGFLHCICLVGKIIKGNKKRLRGPIIAKTNLTPKKLNHQYVENNDISPAFYYLSIDRQRRVNCNVKKITFFLNNNSFLSHGTFCLLLFKGLRILYLQISSSL